MRILHTMLRVNDLNESINFYKNIFGMKVLRQKDYPEGKFSLAFIGYGDEMSDTLIELTHNWDTSKYDHGGALDILQLKLKMFTRLVKKLRIKVLMLLERQVL